jgi:hypothetical protein
VLPIRKFSSVSGGTLGGRWVMPFSPRRFVPKLMKLLEFSTGSEGSTHSSLPTHTPTAKA